MDQLAAEIGRVGLDAAESPLAIALRDADRLAALRALAPPGQRPAASVPGVVAAGQAGARLLRRSRRLSRRAQRGASRNPCRGVGAPIIPPPRASRNTPQHTHELEPPRHRCLRRRRPARRRRRGQCRQDARLLLRRQPRRLQSAVLHHRHDRRRGVGADLQPIGRVRDRNDDDHPGAGRELDRRARRPQLHLQAAQGRQVPQQRQVHADARLQRRRRAVLVQPRWPTRTIRSRR